MLKSLWPVYLIALLALASCQPHWDAPDPQILPPPKPKPTALPSGGQIAARSSMVSARTLEFEVDMFVVDKTSRPIAGLSAADFAIQSVQFPSGTFFSFSQRCAVMGQTPSQGSYSAVLLLDQSGSIASTDPQNLRLEAAKIFFAALGPGDNALLAAFASGGSLPYELNFWGTFGRSSYSAELAWLANKVGGGTPLYKATSAFIYKAAQEAPNVNKAVVVFTDGEDTNGGKTIANIVQEAKSQGVKVFTVGLGQADTAVLSQMALPTGGSMMFAADARQLISQFGTLGNLLSGNLTYYRTCWTAKTDRDAFGSGAWFWSSIQVNTPEGKVSVPFYVAVQ